MKARLVIDVIGNLLVAIEAQCSLLATLEAKVAITAFFLVLGVSLDQLPRHDQCLKLSLRGDRCGDKQRHQDSGCIQSTTHAATPR
jgi:hypothetical protein